MAQCFIAGGRAPRFETAPFLLGIFVSGFFYFFCAFVFLMAPGCAFSMGSVPPSDKFFGIAMHQGLGLNRGYTPNDGIAGLKAVNANSFRDNVVWSVFGPTVSDEVFFAKLDRLGAVVSEQVARPLLILNDGNISVPDSNPPKTDAAKKAFADFSLSVVHATAKYGSMYELWNEWNLKWAKRNAEFFSGGAAEYNQDYSPENYVDLSRRVYERVKAEYPSVKILVGAIGDDVGWLWSKRALKAGLANYGDGVSVHLYNHCENHSSRSAVNLISKLESFHRTVVDVSGKADVDIYVTEFGWPTYSGKCSVTLDDAKNNFTQFILWASATPWVKGVWVYELKDSGRNVEDIESNFGLYDFDNNPKGTVCSVSQSYSLVKRMKTVSRVFDGRAFLLNGTDVSGNDFSIVWAANPSVNEQFYAKSKGVGAVFQICGKKFPPDFLERGVSVTSIPVVVYWRGERTSELVIRERQ